MMGISLLTLVPGELGGTETYARELTRALAADGRLPYRVFAPPVARDAGHGLPTTVVTEYRCARTLPERAIAMALAALRPRRIRTRYTGVRAVHFPLTIPLPQLEVPTAVTLHDLLHLDHPELFPRVEGLLRKLAYDRAARRAGLVIVPSRYVGERAAERLGLPPERVRVIQHGVDGERFTPGLGSKAPEPFLLYPARPWPHKNHARLFEAFRILRIARPELRLVLTGGGHGGCAVPAGVEVRGLVSRDELVSLLRRAAALVFPSLSEGFGSPPLEAMACGCPVAVARATSLPEVCGDAAAYFDPTRPEDIAATVSAVLDAPDDLVRRGLERARTFTWRRSAELHEQAFRELLG